MVFISWKKILGFRRGKEKRKLYCTMMVYKGPIAKKVLLIKLRFHW